MSPKIVDKDAKRLEILQAAMQVFARQGFSKTRIIEIARAAGVGKGTIYEYFRSKEEIFGVAFRFFFEDIEERLAETLRDHQDPVDKLKQLVRVSLQEFLEHDGEFAGIMMDFWSEGVRKHNSDLLRAINLRDIYTHYRSIVASIIDLGIRRGDFRPVDANTAASVLLASLDGLLLQWMLEHDLFDLQATCDAVIDFFVNGLRKP